MISARSVKSITFTGRMLLTYMFAWRAIRKYGRGCARASSFYMLRSATYRMLLYIVKGKGLNIIHYRAYRAAIGRRDVCILLWSLVMQSIELLFLLTCARCVRHWSSQKGTRAHFSLAYKLYCRILTTHVHTFRVLRPPQLNGIKKWTYVSCEYFDNLAIKRTFQHFRRSRIRK